MKRGNFLLSTSATWTTLKNYEQFHVTNLSLWFVFSVELTFIEFLEFSAFELDFASSGMTNEEPVLVVIGFAVDGSGSFGGLSASSTKLSSFSTIITSNEVRFYSRDLTNEPPKIQLISIKYPFSGQNIRDWLENGLLMDTNCTFWPQSTPIDRRNDPGVTF